MLQPPLEPPAKRKVLFYAAGSSIPEIKLSFPVLYSMQVITSRSTSFSHVFSLRLRHPR